MKRMGWKRRLGKLGRWEEENRHNRDEDMEKEAEVARRENKRSDMCWGRVWMNLIVYWNGGRGSEEDGAVLWIKRGGGGGEEVDLIRLFCSAAFSSRIISPQTGSGAHTLSVTEHL